MKNEPVGELSEIVALLRYANVRLNTLQIQDDIEHVNVRKLNVGLLNLTEQLDNSRCRLSIINSIK